MTYDMMEGETSKAFSAFRLYRDMKPDDRSMDKVAKKLGKSNRQIEKWGRRWKWVDRAREYDDAMDKIRVESQENEVKEMAKRHTQIAHAFQGVVAAKMGEYKGIIESGQSLDIRPREVATFADLGIKIERLVKGEPTERIEVPRIKIELVGTNGDESKAD